MRFNARSHCVLNAKNVFTLALTLLSLLVEAHGCMIVDI